MKKIISLLLIGMIVMGQTGFSFATDRPQHYSMKYYDNITPLWTNVSSVFTNIKSKGKIITASVSIQSKNSAMNVSGTLYIQQCNSGRWINKEKWTFSKKGNIDISKKYSASTGGRYRIKIDALVNNERINVLSKEEYVKL